MKKLDKAPEGNSLGRRKFLKGAATGMATLVASAGAAGAVPLVAGRSDAIPPAPQEPQSAAASPARVLTIERPGSDFMVDVFKSLDIEYIAACPGSSFRGLHESVINYGGNKNPELLTCCHEESSVAMAHGYAKIEGKPMAAMVHSTVGLQHAAMAVYNAYVDRVPIFIITGNSLDVTQRRPGVEWDHSAQDGAAMVRDFTKWDDQPVSLQHFAESAVRAYKIAMTPPLMPVLLVADSGLQEDPTAKDAVLHLPKLTVAEPPQGDSGSVAEAARLLVAAENPVIVADRAARTPAGLARLIELAETLQAPVIDQYHRMNFPNRHPLNQSANAGALIRNADVILGLEITDFYGTVNSVSDQPFHPTRSVMRNGAKLISISATDLYVKGNYQDLQRYAEVDLAMAADAETTLPSLIEAVKRQLNDDRKRSFHDRGQKLAEACQKAQEHARVDASYGWDASPISTARMAAEIWQQIQKEDWSLVSDVNFSSRWALRLWDFDKHYQYIGGAGGEGVGYGAPAAVGAALANKKHGRFSVAIQNDGDLLFAPGVLWTSAHHQIPLLSVMHNNRGYHQEVMHIQRMADRRQRGIGRAGIGTVLAQPNVDFAKIAQGMGIYAEGPIEDPKELGPALARAVAVVKRGEPALVDVVTQPR